MPREPDSDPDLEGEIDALIEELGDARAVIRALLHDLDVLAADRERSVSRGYVRGRGLRAAGGDA